MGESLKTVEESLKTKSRQGKSSGGILEKSRKAHSCSRRYVSCEDIVFYEEEIKQTPV